MEELLPIEQLVDEADHLLAATEQYPISFLQRKFRLGYNRAQRLHQLVLDRRSMTAPRQAIKAARE